MHVVPFLETGEKFGVLLLNMQLEYYDNTPDKQRIKYQAMPTTWFERLPSAEEVMVSCQNSRMGWKRSSTNISAGVPGKEGSVYRSYIWHEAPDFPEVLKEMMEYHEAECISTFVGMHPEETGSLNWHVDDYHVWAFNIEGTTEWEWFDLASRGTFKSQVIEPGFILTMPLGISHRVKVLSDYRTSISIITRYGQNGQRKPIDRRKGKQ